MVPDRDWRLHVQPIRDPTHTFALPSNVSDLLYYPSGTYISTAGNSTGSFSDTGPSQNLHAEFVTVLALRFYAAGLNAHRSGGWSFRPLKTPSAHFSVASPRRPHPVTLSMPAYTFIACLHGWSSEMCISACDFLFPSLSLASNASLSGVPRTEADDASALSSLSSGVGVYFARKVRPSCVTTCIIMGRRSNVYHTRSGK